MKLRDATCSVAVELLKVLEGETIEVDDFVDGCFFPVVELSDVVATSDRLYCKNEVLMLFRWQVAPSLDVPAWNARR